jgi:hypothetical protein
MIIFSEDTVGDKTTKSAQETRQLTEIAKIAGLRVYYIPKDFGECETAENALWHIPEQNILTKCFWMGFIPSIERYRAIYDEALKKNIQLLNNPEEHQKAQEFDLSYPFLTGLTPESVIITDIEQCKDSIKKLGTPLFIRGSARSKKVLGWKACVANSLEELQTLVTFLLKNEYSSRGRVIARKLVNLRYSRMSDEGFPLGREYRVFLYNQEVVGYGYYWDGEDLLMQVSQDEEQIILNIAQKAAQKLKIPFVAVDVGQLIDGTWLVIEVNDAQFAGTGHMELFPFINKLVKVVSKNDWK